jgi:hypothetical protein
MEKVKIAEARQLGDGFKTQQGSVLYTFGVNLEDGRKVVANAQSTDPWWGKPGTEAMMELKGQQTSKGMEKVSLKRLDAPQGGYAKPASHAPSHSSGKFDTKGIEVGQALNKAVDVLAATELREHGYNPDKFEEQLYQVASQILRVGELLREGKPMPKGDEF